MEQPVMSECPPIVAGTSGKGDANLGDLPRRFVVLEHDWPSPHFDLMIDDGQERLRTFALDRLPDNTSEPVLVPELARHRRSYLDYEGPVSGGRGSVRRIDAGRATLSQTSPERLRVVLAGVRFNGTISLERTTDQSPRGPVWRLIYQSDC
jgi:hypothetical protein